MTKEDFDTFAAYVLEYNTYLQKGYANVFKDSRSNYPLVMLPSGDLSQIFPNDYSGNYFYIRNDEGLSFSPQYQGRQADCGPGRVSFLDTLIMNMVVMVRNGDPYKLIANIRNTCMSYKPLSIVPIRGNWNREQIIIDELRGCNDKEIEDALKKCAGWIIVRLTLQTQQNYFTDYCIVNPCITC